MYDAVKLTMLIVIWVTLMAIVITLVEIRDDRIMRVTEVKYIYQIETYYGDLTFEEKADVYTPSLD